MNARRRKEIMRAADLIEQAREILQNAMEEETEALENLRKPQKWQKYADE